MEATAGIALDLLDVSLRPITFFTGSSGIMSAVWSAPSEQTYVMQVSFKGLPVNKSELLESSVQGSGLNHLNLSDKIYIKTHRCWDFQLCPS